MEIINQMNDLIRKDLREVKINLDLYDREIMALNSSIQVAVKELERARTRVEADNTKRIKDLITKMKTYQPKMVEAQEKLKTYQGKKIEIKKAKEQYQNQKRSLELEIKGLQTKINLYNQDKCPTCETPFSEKRFDLLKENLNENFTKKQTSFLSLIHI